MKAILCLIFMLCGFNNLEPCEPPEVDYSGLKEQTQIEMLYTEEEIVACAKLIYGEYGADWVSDTEKAKVVCTVVNRTHSERWIAYVGSDELMAQLTAPDQFYYLSYFPCTDRHYRIAYDVLWRASQIAQGCEGIVWECDTCNYYGDGWVNHFY
ncbi:MAG: hypothetical protein KBT06_10685 [Prevotellaceae bacterium]|nr:hypothetical protein [Candidatus Colivivens equi]